MEWKWDVSARAQINAALEMLFNKVREGPSCFWRWELAGAAGILANVPEVLPAVFYVRGFQVRAKSLLRRVV